MKKNRLDLPFRRNCEGYFLKSKEKILAKEMSFGIIFPGGGISDSESIESGMLRETFEETKATITHLNLITSHKLVWDKNWAKTEKQKERYERYQGDEMFFFKGQIQGFHSNDAEHEDIWRGEKLMDLSIVIEKLKEKHREEPKEYTKIQISILEDLKNL